MGFDPSVARLLGHDPTPRPTCPVMPDKGTRNAIFVLKRRVEKQKDVYTCFIDYSKAFDTVKHDSLVELLQSLDIDDADTQLLTKLIGLKQPLCDVTKT